MREALTVNRVRKMRKIASSWDFGAGQSSSFREPARDAWETMLRELRAHELMTLCDAYLQKSTT